MTNHEIGAKLLTRIVLPDLAGIGEVGTVFIPDFDSRLQTARVAMRVIWCAAPRAAIPGISTFSIPGTLGNCPSDGQTGNQPWPETGSISTWKDLWHTRFVSTLCRPIRSRFAGGTCSSSRIGLPL